MKTYNKELAKKAIEENITNIESVCHECPKEWEENMIQFCKECHMFMTLENLIGTLSNL